MIKNIQQLPSRYEPLMRTLGENAKTTFFEPAADMQSLKTLVAQMKSSTQGKWMFIYHSSESGAGKTTFIHSLSIFMSDQISEVLRLPPPGEITYDQIPAFLASIPKSNKVKVVNFDQHESLFYSDEQYRSLLVQINGILRNRDDILILWPVNDLAFAERLVALQKKIGGSSAFGSNPIYKMQGLNKDQYKQVLDRILVVANWTLNDAAIDEAEIDDFAEEAPNIGSFLDLVQAAIASRFDIGNLGFTPPKIVFVLSSGKPEVRDVCRNLRRADSYYVEASRLMMYTKRSNVAEWWQERNKVLTTALPFVVALFDAQLLAISGSAVVHSVLNFGDDDLKALASNVTKNLGNGKRVMQSTELLKFSNGQEVDSREYGLNVQDETREAYARVQAQSKLKHKAINMSVMSLLEAAGGGFVDVEFEQAAGVNKGLLVDALANRNGERHYIELHHKADTETDNNSVAIYILTKLKEYAINFGIATP